MTSQFQKVRIFHIFKTYMPDTQGGIQEAINQICLYTSQYGIENQVLTLSHKSTPKLIQRPESLVIRYPTVIDFASTPIGGSLLWEYKNLISEADILHYHFPWPFGDLLHLISSSSKPTLLTYHAEILENHSLRKIYYPLMRWFLSNVDHIIVASPTYLKTSKDLADFRHKCTVIPYGLNQAAYPQIDAAKVKHWRERVGENFYLFVGVLRHYKGLHTLLDAAAQTNHQVVILGSGPMEDKLKAQAQELKLNNVTFLGFLDDVDKVALISLCRAVVLPSHLRNEAFGISLLEGAMFGKPMISTEIGTGTSYVNEHGVTGIVVPPEQPNLLRDAMDTLANNPEMATAMGQAARQRYETLFTSEKMGRDYMSVYEKLLDLKKPI
jgi:glycosyltransferase involved in cell wall biosynthesis